MRLLSIVRKKERNEKVVVQDVIQTCDVCAATGLRILSEFNRLQVCSKCFGQAILNQVSGKHKQEPQAGAVKAQVEPLVVQ